MPLLEAAEDSGAFGMVVTVGIFGMNLLPFLWTFAKGFLSPGRKGSMRTVRDTVHEDVSLDFARTIYLDRLKFEGFEVELEQGGTRLTARRGKLPGNSPFSVHTHASKPLELKMEFRPLDRGVGVRLEMTMKDFVIVDTGEGKYIDETLDRLMGADLEREEAPVVPNETFKTTVAFQIAFLMLFAPILLFAPGFTTEMAGGLMLVLIVEFFVSVVLALLGILDCFMRPGEMTGKGKSLVAMLMGLGALLWGGAAFILLHGAALWEQIRPR